MRLLISCPKCDTSYEIDEQQIRESGGQARCYNCQHVFNAMLNSQPVIDDGTDSTSASPIETSTSFDTSSAIEDIVIDGTDPIIASPPPSDTDKSRPLRAEEVLNIKTEDLPSLDPIEVKTTKPRAPSSMSSTLTWSLAIIALLVVTLAQLGWFNRQHLLNNEQSRQMIEAGCSILALPCNLPPRRAPELYAIVDRKISTVTEVNGVLNLSILFENRASFDQPAPGIELSLFDARHKLIARRSFSPKDYLTDRPGTAPLYAPNHVQKISLNLEDPGSDVTGFEFDFF